MNQIPSATISRERWFSFSIEMRMGHIGSEITRLLSSRQRGDKEKEMGAYARSIEMLNLTLMDASIGNGRKEIEILKEVLEDMQNTKPKLEIEPILLQNYFAPFAFLYAIGLQ
ncbi:MAG: hypothetical protein WC878_07355 [Candidatus Paceibacterota bacterium]|jgi:hypothetical protein